jgi:alkylated DNA repair dioxygenase AlkB
MSAPSTASASSTLHRQESSASHAVHASKKRKNSATAEAKHDDRSDKDDGIDSNSHVAPAEGGRVDDCVKAGEQVEQRPANKRTRHAGAAADSSAGAEPGLPDARLDQDLTPSVSERQRVGDLDSYINHGFFSRKQADAVLRRVRRTALFLSRQDPRVQFRMYNRQGPLPRDKAFYGSIRATCNGTQIEPYYKYAKVTPQLEDWKGHVLERVAQSVDQGCGQPCNHVVVNHYKDGKDHISFHHDKSASFHPGSSVLTVSLGATRTLRLKCVKGKAEGQTFDLPLTHGSLFVLGPETNKYWKHAIVKAPRLVEGRQNDGEDCSRISLTYRQIAATREVVVDDSQTKHVLDAADD